MFELKKSIISPVHDTAESSEIEFLTNLVKEGDYVIDVGAYVGDTTIPLAKKVGSGKVFAFECQRAIYYALCGNVVLNNLHETIQAFPHAAYVVSGQEAYMPKIDYTKTQNYGLVHPTTTPTPVPVTTMRIDDLNLNKLRLLKMDVLGMEWDVIRGGDITIRRHFPLIYFKSVHSELTAGICEYLENLGYEWGIYDTNVLAFKNENFPDLVKDLRTSNDSQHQVLFAAIQERKEKRKKDGRIIII